MGGEEGFAAHMASVDPLTLLSDAGTTGVPTVLLHGEVDEEVPLTQFSDYAAVHHDLRTVVLPGTGHYTLIEPGATAAREVADTLWRMAREQRGPGTAVGPTDTRARAKGAGLA